ncbi:MAG TPA: DUF2267 domain-containing protein [Chitinophagaceae bacterium]|jgi:uncharacterized protein (DUF2267 family)|nr:DUF2267 domain-containing protein [Chitinophagaceae bacterium]
MSLDFEKYAAKGNELVNMLAKDLQIHPDNAGRILRSVLHALRKHLGIDESFQLLSQLPMALKGVYVDQWDPSESYQRIHTVEEFLDEVRSEDKGLAGYDFGNNEKARNIVRTVFKDLTYYLSEGEFDDFTAMLPGELKKFIRESIGEGKMVL